MDTAVRQDGHFLQTVGKAWLVKQRVPGTMVEDILQTAWINTYKARCRQSGIHPEYAFTCVRSARIDMWRTERKYVFPDDLLETWEADMAAADLLDVLAYRHAHTQGLSGASPETAAIQHDLSVKVRAVCAQLGEQDKTYWMIHRRYCDGAAPAQIARELGVTPQTVYNRTGPAALERALDAVRQILLTPEYRTGPAEGTKGDGA